MVCVRVEELDMVWVPAQLPVVGQVVEHHCISYPAVASVF